MADFKNKFESKRQDWGTPSELFDPLDKEFHFTLDVCATKYNTKCKTFYTEEDDALKQNWNGVCWMNPPYKSVGTWLKKAYEESMKGAIVVCLIPSRTNTNWWHEYCMKGEIRFIKGRPKFGGSTYGLPQPLSIIIFNNRGIMNKMISSTTIYPRV